MKYKVKDNVKLDKLERYGFKKYDSYYYNEEAEIKVIIESREVLKKCSNEVYSYLMEDNLLEEMK